MKKELLELNKEYTYAQMCEIRVKTEELKQGCRYVRLCPIFFANCFSAKITAISPG